MSKLRKALVINQYGEARQRLHRLVEACGRFEVVSMADIAEAKQGITDLWSFDFVFVSRVFDEQEIASLIEKVRRTAKGDQTAFVLVGTSDTESSKHVASNMVAGVHAFLCEPLTVDLIQQVCRIAQSVRNQDTETRLRAATGLMLTDLMSEMTGDRHTAVSLWDRVQHTCDVYKKMTGESVTSAVVALQNVSQSKRLGSYNGVSKRVRDIFKSRLERKIKQLPAEKIGK